MTCEERLVLVSPRSRVVRVNRSISRSRVDAPRGATLYAPDSTTSVAPSHHARRTTDLRASVPECERCRHAGFDDRRESTPVGEQRPGAVLLSLDGSLMSVPVVPGRTWNAQAPLTVIDRDVFRDVSISLRTYDVSPDGRRFLVIKDAPNPSTAPNPSQVIVVQNWMEEWKRLGRR